jgi:hypothetical protein
MSARIALLVLYAMEAWHQPESLAQCGDVSVTHCAFQNVLLDIFLSGETTVFLLTRNNLHFDNTFDTAEMKPSP